MTPWLTIVGIGEDGWDGLSTIARCHIERAEFLVGGKRHLAMIPEGKFPFKLWGSPFQKTLDEIIERRGTPVVVLATGDPMWFGVGATLCSQVPASETRIFPAPSAFSLVAARLGWPLAEVECLTAHSRTPMAVRMFLADEARLIVLSKNHETPLELATMLTEAGYGGSELSVFSHLQGEDEALVKGSASSWSSADIPALNTIAVHCHVDAGVQSLARIAGLPDDAFEHDGQLTKREIRAATVAALSPMPGHHLWDVGAGCGSIAIEWMRSARGATATAVERNPERVLLIENNALALGVPDLTITEGEAPGLLDDLLPPQAVFLGGGITDPALANWCWTSLSSGGRFVANAVTFEGESVLFKLAEMTAGELVKFEISRSAGIGRFNAWEPMKPVTQLRALKL